MRNDPEKHRYCRNCGTPIDPGVLGPGDGLCSQCQVTFAEKYLPEKTDPALFRQLPKSSAVRIGLWAVLLICVGMTLFQIPVFRGALSDPKPIRAGAVETDGLTDACIQNLWQAARDLQERRAPAQGLLCPVSGKPYKVVKEGDVLQVLCPNPREHHLTTLRLSSESMVPEVIR